MIWEFECPGLQHPIIGIFGSRFLKIYFLNLLLSRGHILRTLFNIQAGKGSCLDGVKENISASRFLIYWFLYMGFYCTVFGKKSIAVRQFRA